MVLIPERLSGGRDRKRNLFARPRRNREESTDPPSEGLPYNRFLGFHADEDNGLDSPLLVTQPLELCGVTPAGSMQGAMALWRHLAAGNAATMAAQRAAAAAADCESPTIILVPFTTGSPGTNDPAQNAAVLAALPGQLALYAAENPIFGFGNLNADNFMVGATAAARNAAWWALEAQAIAVIEAEGYRWCATDDQGIVSLCQTIADRTAAWIVEGVDPADCEFLCAHCYDISGHVPALELLAEDSLARAGVATPIRVTEGAFDFFRVGEVDADRPWILNEYPVGNSFGYPPHSLTRTRLNYEWHAHHGKHYLPFDWTVFVRSLALSSVGGIFTTFQRNQPAFVEPPLGSVWFDSTNAPTRAYAIRLSNGGTVGEATTAGNRVAAGYIWTR